MSPGPIPLLAVLLLAPEPITDFGDGGRRLAWTSVNDDVMGGRSRGTFSIEDGVLVFSGSLDTDGGGFASVRSAPQPLGLGGRAGIHLRVRGDGRTYAFLLREDGAEARRGVSYRAEFRTVADGAWHEVRLPFASFVASWRGRTLDRPPVRPDAIAGLGVLLADGTDGPFRLEIDSIAAYRPFSLDAVRWKARPVLVFAPRADDARVSRQLAALREDEAGLRDRAMLVVLVLADGASRAGDVPLSAAEAAALRERFGVAPDAFAVLLVGKDGGVKQRADRPVDPAGLFARVDAMPMRRAELEERARGGSREPR